MRMIPVKNTLLGLLMVFTFCLSASSQSKPSQKWIQLFNGKDLTGWDIKIAGFALNDNYKKTFQVDNGVLRVNYDQYEKFNSEFGHIYYKKPYSYYLLHMEYRFIGNQLTGGSPGNNRNSGVMIHSQSATSMGLDQSFPVSLEIQFLGGLGNGKRPTANLCTPGTIVESNGKTFTDHIIQSSSKTYDGDQWVTIDAIVLGDSIIRHFVNGEEVLSYTKTRIGGGFVGPNHDWTWGKVKDADEWKKKDETPLISGYIALQAESHPIEFKNIELLDLNQIKGWKKLDLPSLFPKPK